MTSSHLYRKMVFVVVPKVSFWRCNIAFVVVETAQNAILDRKNVVLSTKKAFYSTIIPFILKYAFVFVNITLFEAFFDAHIFSVVTMAFSLYPLDTSGRYLCVYI